MVKKIKDDFEYQELGEELCKYCDWNPDDCEGGNCEQAYENYLGQVEDNKVENIENIEDEMGMFELKVDAEGLRRSIVASVKSEISNTVKETIMTDIKKEILGAIKTEIEEGVHAIVKEYMQEIYEQEVIQIGGGWDKEVETMSMKDYIKDKIKEVVQGKEVKKKRGNERRGNEQGFAEYFVSECVGPEVNRQIEKEVKKASKDVNDKLKKVFDTQLNQMLSEVALGALKTNATYVDVQKKLGLLEG